MRGHARQERVAAISHDTRLISLARIGLVLAGIASLVLCLGFVLEAGWATALWPWPERPLSYLFLGSIAAAIALPLLWIGVTGELAAAAAGALNLTVTYAGASAYLISIADQAWQPPLGPAIAVCVVAGLFSLAVFAATRRLPFRDERPMPRLVRVSFVVFAAALIASGTGLVLGAHVFHWPTDRDSSALYGFIFLGAAVYFLHGALRPRWANAAGQLVGFLAYDLILIVPFVARFGEVSSGDLISLSIYTTFVVYSGGLAAYYLTRQRSAPRSVPDGGLRG